jgi:hypothetical protein
MLTTQPTSMPLRQCLIVIMTRWQKLMRIAAYRPELYYMRGPGPKWHAKHRARAECGPL